jgi:hypothetical protein
MKKKGYWTKERCIEEAKKFDTNKEWVKNSCSSNAIARKNGWLDECRAHMKLFQLPDGYWTKEKCLKTALECQTNKEWRKKYSTAYQIARRNGWLDECRAHMMNISGNRYNRIIYLYLFPKEMDGQRFYVGLSYNPKIRNKSHMTSNKSKVYQYIQKSSLQPQMIYLTNPIPVKEAKKMEAFFQKKYVNLGYTPLSNTKAGSTGGTISKWSLEKCKEDALKYNNRSEWDTKSKAGYCAAHSNEWLDECCQHMKRLHKPNGYWTLEKCKEDALKYNKVSKWDKNSSSAYTIAKSKKWLDDCCGHMERLIRKPSGYWTLEKCKERAAKYKGRWEWQRKCKGSYQSAYNYGWLDECCGKCKK